MLDDGDLDAAVAAGLLDEALREKLDAFAAARRGASQPVQRDAVLAPAARFDAIHVLYYAGALIVIGAMGIFATTAFEGLGGWGLFGVAVAYAGGLTALGNRLWRSAATRMPGGLLIAAAASMAPLAVYGVQDALDVWSADKPRGYADFYPLINASWVYMELAAVVAAAVALRYWPFPFILLIASLALWFMSMDLAALILHHRASDWEVDYDLRRRMSEIFGGAMILLAWILDVKWRRLGDFGFWLHLFGALALWGGITAGGGGEFAAAGYCAFNIAFIAFGVFLNRRVYAVFGVIGVTMYLGHLAADLFKDAISFTFALTALGLAIVFAGVWLERRRAALSDFFDHHLPAPIRALRPGRA